MTTVLECVCGKKLPTPDTGRSVTCSCARSYRCTIDIPQLAANVVAIALRLERLESKP